MVLIVMCACILSMVIYKVKYQHKIGYIQFKFPDEEEPLKWYNDYYSIPFRIIRLIITACLLGLLACIWINR